MTSSSASRSTWSRISRTPAVPSEARVWMCRSARGRGDRSSRRPRTRGCPVPWRASRVEVRPDRREDGPPLLGRLGDRLLHSRREPRSSPRRGAPGACPRRGRRPGAAGRDIVRRLPAAPRRPRSGRPRSTASRPGPIGSGAATPKNGTSIVAAGNVAVGDHPDGLAPRRARRSGPDAPRAGRRCRRRRTPRVRVIQAWRAGSPSVSIGAVTLRPVRATANRAGNSTAPKCMATKSERPGSAERILDRLGRLDDEPALDVGDGSGPGGATMSR